MTLLKENPYLHHGDMPEDIYELPGTISPNALKRDFSHLFSVEIKSMTIDILMDRWNSSIIGVQDGWKNSANRVNPLYGLRIQDNIELKSIPDEIRNRKLISFDKHRIVPDIRNNSVASIVYRKLVNHGYAIISDRTHFEPAMGLWIKIAKNSDENHKVILVDVDYGVLKDYDGNTLYYDGSNFTGYNLVLVYYSK